MYGGAMMGICMRYLQHHENARDAMQDGFIKAFDRIGSFQGKGSLKSWLSSLFVHHCLDVLRSQKRVNQRITLTDEPANLESGAGGHLSVVNDVHDELSTQEILDLVNHLPDKYRIVINMYCIDGMTHAEIAACTGMSEGTSKAQLHRARQLLLTTMKDYNTTRQTNKDKGYERRQA